MSPFILRNVPSSKISARFVEPMLLLRTENLPGDGDIWRYEIKHDGYRSIALKSRSQIYLRSRNNNDFVTRYPVIAKALASLLNETVIDGEIVAFDGSGKPSFNLLQNRGSSGVRLFYYVFDVMVIAGKSLRGKRLERRQKILEQKILPKLSEPIRYVGELKASLPDLIESVTISGLEGLVAKRRDSICERGLRSGACLKMRVNRGQEFVIGGYTVGGKSFDALVFGYYEGQSPSDHP